jgi:adenylate cyclase
MGELPVKYSPAVESLWKAAALIARQRQSLIEPEFILYRILAVDAGGPSSTAEEEAPRAEIEKIRGAFAVNGVIPEEAGELLRAHWPAIPAPTSVSAATRADIPISRSERCKQAFHVAADAASRDGAHQVELRHLVAGILLSSSDIPAFLGIDATRAASIADRLACRAPTLQPVPSAAGHFLGGDKTEVILGSLDATVVLNPNIDWKAVGPKLAALCELSWESGSTGDVAVLLQTAIQKLLATISKATHGAVLILKEQSGELLLKAHAPRGAVSVSMSSATDALNQKRAFLWQRQQDLSQSQMESNVESGIYAPIIAEGRSFGVICVNADQPGARLTAEDLFLTASLGHQIGLVLANRSLKAEIADKVSILERLMTNFSPQVRTHLIQRAQAGRLKLGGERSEVSVVCADIRGFTAMAATMDTEDLMQLLNEYFAAMVGRIFHYDGTIDKFIGDAVLAVFGSPEKHPRHCEQATRAAQAMQAAAREVSERRRANGLSACEIGIGVHTGEVIHGFVGSADRMEFTIIGDAVNMTTRYCAAAAAGEIVISPAVYEKLWRLLKVEPIEIATKHEGTHGAYRLITVRNP